MMSDEILWSVDDGDCLHHTAGDAIDAWFDDVMPEKVDDIPTTITLHKWCRVKPRDRYSCVILADLLERLEEEYGDPEEVSHVAPTPTMVAAAQSFVRAVLAEYKAWACERTGETEDVDLREWLRENDETRWKELSGDGRARTQATPP